MRKKLILIVVISIVLGFWAGVWFQKERIIAQGTACTSSLRLIDSSKDEAAQHLGLKKGDAVPESEVAKYCKDGVLPTCPAGGMYAINAIGYSPKCSMDPRESYFHRCGD